MKVLLKEEDLECKDIIEFTEEELSKIYNWCNKNNDLIHKNYENILNTFNEVILVRKLNSYNRKSVYHILSEDNNIKIVSYFRVNKNVSKNNLVFLHSTSSMDFNLIKEKLFNMNNFEDVQVDDWKYSDYFKNQCDEGKIDISKALKKEVFEYAVSNYFAILIYSLFNQESIIRQTTTHTKKIQSKKDKRAGKKPKVKLIKQNIIKIITDHIPELTKDEKTHYERHIFGWTVRGHWREYKSGKKIWIKPQVRGDKDKVEGRIYEV